MLTELATLGLLKRFHPTATSDPGSMVASPSQNPLPPSTHSGQPGNVELGPPLLTPIASRFLGLNLRALSP